MRLGAGEHLQRPGDVEALDAVEKDEEEGALGHVPILRRTRSGRNDVFPTFPAMAGDEGRPLPEPGPAFGPAARHAPP
ncbi:hypothetical protein GCM10010260_52920 [Streptomyces filipinensis]|uniref:Uncharacterized protein n=1 Tax=Streptomyces filipinensis TaxID=66887 RepID=A0A918IF11_9ACTN|nr:hypothetical protein GCM10010260_52920 [Streptomyces filipinensis]